MKIAVITPSLPHRSNLLAQCKASVQAQTLPAFHLTGFDSDRIGPARVRNILVSSLPPEYDWIAFLDDDDLLFPDHLEKLAAVTEDADVIYSRCRQPHATKHGPFDRNVLRVANFISVTSLVRRSMFEKVGGFPDAPKLEDWLLWNKIADAGGRFVFVNAETWIYRVNPEDSRNANTSCDLLRA